ncbi:MAG TPA: biopolymer transporter ExbD [Gammaproteobacteria bacterium]|nr:biopolymer transporter ExbD [Gammaproteobacteria bacterium]
MKSSRRMRRLTRYQAKLETIQLTSLMDVFTCLVFFLIVHHGDTQLLEAPKEVTLPLSNVETKPRETVVIYVNKDDVVVQGQPVVRIADIEAGDGKDIEPIMARLAELQERVIGLQTQAVADAKEVTILADKSIPFSVIKQIMSTCTDQGYEKISLAVLQKELAGENS